MKSIINTFLGYFLLGVGLGPLIFKTFEDSSGWLKWFVTFFIFFGLILMLEGKMNKPDKEG